MTYSEKLKDGRWLDFRREYIARKRHQRGGWDSKDWCDDCGQDTCGAVHVHHRVYRDGKEPWEYDDEDLRLLCGECHDLIHATEERARNLIRRLPPHCCYEFNDLLTELERCFAAGDTTLKIALAHSKNEARTVYHHETGPEDESINVLVQTVSELQKKYIEMYRDR